MLSEHRFYIKYLRVAASVCINMYVPLQKAEKNTQTAAPKNKDHPEAKKAVRKNLQILSK